jgi:hypothetical protein
MEVDVIAIINRSRQTQEQPFGVIKPESLNKREFSFRLFSAAQELGMVTYIVRESPNFLETFRFRDVLFKKCRGIAIYAIRNESAIDSGVQLMLSRRLWHPTVFHVVLAAPTYELRLNGYCASSMGIMEFEIANKDASFCTIEFVDDDAFFYGDESAQKEIAALYPELEQV